MRSSDTEMLERYLTRTMEHIHRVQKNMVYLLVNHRDELGLTRDEVRQCMENVAVHDQSKFSVTQFEPYVELTEYHHQRKVLKNDEYEYPEGMKAKVDEAVNDHYYQENHHPERIKHDVTFNFAMLEAIETCCDLQAMAQEFNEGSCRGFFENVWMQKHKMAFESVEHFTTAIEYMNMVIKCFEEGIENGKI